MSLDDRQFRQFRCGCCEAPIERVWNFVHRSDVPRAVYFANCYHHAHQPHDAFFDVVIGTWGQEGVVDRVTFGCRVGPVQDGSIAATLVDALQGQDVSPLHGRVLTRGEGLAHPLLAEFWEIVDFVLEHDPTVRPHLYGSAG